MNESPLGASARRRGRPKSKLKAIRHAAKHSFPTADIEQMLREIGDGYAPRSIVTLTGEQRAEPDRRLAEYKQNPVDVIPWDEVRAELLKKR